jgi:hypothetical protein
MIPGMVTVGIGFLLAAAGFIVAAISTRPPGARVRYSITCGLLESATPTGKALGLIGIALLVVASLCLARGFEALASPLPSARGPRTPPAARTPARRRGRYPFHAP